MKDYRIQLCRHIKFVEDIYIQAETPEDALVRFEHQLESEQCSALEAVDWASASGQYTEKQGVYNGEYDVCGVIEE
jgi:hypothetical protein